MNVSLIMSMSADGFITRHQDGLVDWTSKEDKKHFVAMTKDAGVLICGKSTFDTYGKPLPGRLNIVMTRNPDVTKNIPDLLEFTNQSPEQILENLAQRGFAKVALTGGAEINTLFMQKNLIDELYLTIEPRLFGAGKRLFNDFHADKTLKFVEQTRLNEQTILLHYEVVK